MKSKIFSHIFVVLISLGGASFCAHLLYLDIYVNKTTIDGLSEAGLIKEKYQTVKRKFSENMLWDLVETQDKLYWFDSIQTAEKAQATIQLLDGSEIKLGPASLVVLEKDNDQLALNLKNGQLVLQASQGTKDIKVNGVNINNDEGNTLTLNIDKAKGQLTAVQTTADGTGKQIIINKDGSTEEKELPAVLESPVALYRINTDLETEKIDFSWNTKKKDSIFELALDDKFKNIINSKTLKEKTALSISLKAGTYYWRIKTTGGLTSEVRMFDINKMHTPELIGPSKNEQITYKKDFPIIEFNWSNVANSKNYYFEASTDEQFKNLLFQEELIQNKFKTSKLVDGPIYWRVSSVYDKQRKPSSISKIEIKKLVEPLTPRLTAPSSDFDVEYEYFSKNKGIPFNWEHDGTTEYKFVISESSNFEKPLFFAKTKEKTYLLQEALKEGTYYWAVGHKNLDGQWVYKNQRKIKIGYLKPPLAAPEFEMEEVQ
ncbi:MAG: FecR domain-containing protein [Oligoflexia bacterium]|nr:FecR domain-containing protein [Oligoflexia bacterium]